MEESGTLETPAITSSAGPIVGTVMPRPAVAYKDEELRGPMPSTGEVANDKKKKMLQYAQHVRIAMKFVDMVQRKGVSGDNDGDGASESAQ